MPELAVDADEVVRWATARLAAAGVEAPRREALRLARELPPRAEEGRYRAAVERRVGGEPAAYVVGLAGFRYLTLAVDRRVLIPRPETEGLVEAVLEAQPTGVAMDVGTGSGAIALSLAGEGRYARVIGVDASRGALSVAAANRDTTGAAVDLVAGDLISPFGEGVVDVLVANPPYLTLQEYQELDASVRAWEPAAALVSGVDGQAATAGLVRAGLRTVRPGGLLALEVDCRRAGAVAALARDAGWLAVEVRADVFGRDRYVLARKRGSS